MAQKNAREQGGDQRSDGHGDKHIGNRGQGNRNHEGGEHHRPADSRDPQRPPCPNKATPQSATLHDAQDGNQGQRIEQAAPEVDLKAPRDLKMARDYPGDAPQQRDEDHQRDRTSMSHHSLLGSPGASTSSRSARNSASSAVTRCSSSSMRCAPADLATIFD